MKRTGLYAAVLAAIAITFPAAVMAAPWLACDPYPASQPQPTQFLLSFDGAPEITVPAEESPNAAGKWLHYDLAGISFGRHTVNVKATNGAMVSSGASLTFDTGIATPSGLIILP